MAKSVENTAFFLPLFSGHLVGFGDCFFFVCVSYPIDRTSKAWAKKTQVIFGLVNST